MMNFKGRHSEREILLWAGAVVCGLSHFVSAAGGNDGQARGRSGPLHP